MSDHPQITDDVIANPDPGDEFAWTEEQLAAAVDAQTDEVGDDAEPATIGEADEQ